MVKKSPGGHHTAHAQRHAAAERIRRRVAELILTSDSDGFASVSAYLERSHSYIQQYVRRGSPVLLRESDRRRIARYFGIPESELLLPEEIQPVGSPPLVTIERWARPWETKSGVQVDLNWLQGRFGIDPHHLLVLTVDGDAMAPTLQAGDDILVDTSERDPYRDGIYVLALGDKPTPKRITVHPSSKTLVVSSDNAQYAVFENCRRDDLDIIGRVVWVARRL